MFAGPRFLRTTKGIGWCVVLIPRGFILFRICFLWHFGVSGSRRLCAVAARSSRAGKETNIWHFAGLIVGC